jgi:hypothetical protein
MNALLIASLSSACIAAGMGDLLMGDLHPDGWRTQHTLQITAWQTKPPAACTCHVLHSLQAHSWN